MKDVNELGKEELWALFTDTTKRLRELGEIKGKNVVGDRGELLAVSIYNETPNLPKLQLAPPSTKNIDAISVKGDRYSIKTISYPNKTTGVFHGYGSPDKPVDNKLFEYLIVVVLDNYMPHLIVEITWENFYKFKKWHSTMQAYNITLTKEVLAGAKVIYKK